MYVCMYVPDCLSFFLSAWVRLSVYLSVRLNICKRIVINVCVLTSMHIDTKPKLGLEGFLAWQEIMNFIIRKMMIMKLEKDKT